MSNGIPEMVQIFLLCIFESSLDATAAQSGPAHRRCYEICF